MPVRTPLSRLLNRISRECSREDLPRTCRTCLLHGGHYWLKNHDVTAEGTPDSLHDENPEGGYTSSVFDVVHEHGLSTGLYWAPNKGYRTFSTSYGETHGKAGAHGRNKIDHSIATEDSRERIQTLLQAKADFSFIYFHEADGAGHRFGYLGPQYRGAIHLIDEYLGELLQGFETDPFWKRKTVLLLTGDHGGEPGKRSHGNFQHPYCYTVPLLAWGAGVAKGADLYELNKDTRKNPGEGHPSFADPIQPIRNADIGNLSLRLLGLPAIPGSFINQKQDLRVQ